MSSTVLAHFEEVGVVQYPTDLDPANPGADHGHVLARLGKHLDAVARTLGVRPLSDFHFADPEMLTELAADLEGPPRDSILRLIETQREWHPVVEGRATTAALICHLERLDATTASERHPELLLGRTLGPVLADLRALQHVLAGNDARFHLEAL